MSTSANDFIASSSANSISLRRTVSLSAISVSIGSCGSKPMVGRVGCLHLAGSPAFQLVKGAYMPKRRRGLSPTKREQLYERERAAAIAAGAGDHPICNRCGLPVTPGQAWDESHEPTPHAFGGHATGVAHARCNREHGAREVWPLVAKSNRKRRYHIGASGPGLGRNPMPCSRRSGQSKTMRRGVVKRETQGQKFKRAMAKRYFTGGLP